MDLRDSLREPSGRPFAPLAEADLLDDLVQTGRRISRSESDLLALREVVAPFGTPDLVVVEQSHDQVAARLASGVAALLNRTDADVVSTLNARTRREVEDICQILMWEDASIVERRIPKLLRVGAIHRSSRGGYLRHPEVRPLARLHALEAKVRDWRGGIDQARTYALWADTATLLVGHLPRDNNRVLEEARSWSLGLADTSQLLIRPRLRRHTVGRRLWASEHIVAALTAR
jgi:predicted transcriptional regulator